MRLTILATILAGSSIAAAQPESPPEYETPPGAVPPININITNNNTGNNSNTNTQTSTAPIDVSTPVATTIAPPGLVEAPRGRPPIVERLVIAPSPARFKWLVLGVTGGESGPGVRASFDVLARGRFSLGVAASASGHGEDLEDGADAGGPGEHARGSGGAVAYVAYTKRLRRVEVRVQVGLGFGGRADREDDEDGQTIARTVGGAPETERDQRCSPRAEAALLVALPLTRRLGLIAGPIVTATGDQDDLERDDDDRRESVDKRFMAGVRFGF